MDSGQIISVVEFQDSAISSPLEFPACVGKAKLNKSVPHQHKINFFSN